ncbi:Flp pilus assembly protein CpaB [Xylophilus sp. ASV27]|uniref:Flp pilus assembly protein CpaB n=1 Tax=Xylophilus sp. ASV27 TaxID=2795129 RepID=UPI0018EBF46F|nr:Flp pilus assembly protein CpaB [Xylophilus sp. ASV27]
MGNFTKIAAILLIVIGLALGGYAWYLGRHPAPPPPAAAASTVAAPPAALKPIVVTSRAVPAGKPLEEADLRVESLPMDPEGAFHAMAAAVGRVPVLDLGAGAPVLVPQLATGLALRVAQGERAVAVKVDEANAVGHRVQPGDMVDVFFVLKRDNGEIDRSQARLLLAKKRVLAYGEASLDGPDEADPNAKGAGARQQRAAQARTAVLAVPVEDVDRLALGEASGRLLLALRNPQDESLPDPALFAALPTALQPVSARPGAAPPEPLQGMDRAQAGLAIAALVDGGVQRPATAAAAQPVPVHAAARPTPRRATAGAPPATERVPVEFIRGDKQELAHY